MALSGAHGVVLIATPVARHIDGDPVLLGTGKRLFTNGTVPSRLKPVETRTSSTGVVLQVLESAGTLEYGSFALEHPPEAEIERRQKIEVGE